MEPGNPTSTAVRTEVQPLPVSVPKAVFPMGVDTPDDIKHDPKGCDERYMEMCVLSGSQVVSRLPPASVAETAARAASLDFARCFIVLIC